MEWSMRALITGGAGFIGSHLAEELLRRGHRVALLDDLSTGARENIESLVARDDVRFVKSTVLEEGIVRSLVDEADVVFHLAAAVKLRSLSEHPVRSLQVNVRGTETVLQACCRAGRKVIVASSGEVYGRNGDGRLREGDGLALDGTPTRRGGYACAKVLGEFLAMAYHQEKGLPVIVARLFDVCGPRQSGPYARVIPCFVGQALRGDPLTVYGDGKQVRSFLYVGDAVNALVGLAEHPRAVGEVFNVGSPHELTVEALAWKVKAITKSASPIAYIPSADARADGLEDMRCRVPDVRKLQALLGDVPHVPLGEALRRIIAFMAGRPGLRAPGPEGSGRGAGRGAAPAIAPKA
jgi:UDP-glucose 4-epimerase